MRPNRDPTRLQEAPRCHARSKRTGKPCRAPAVRGYKVCRMHGARGGAPRGNKNAMKHGYYSEQAIQQRKAVAELIRRSREIVGSMH